MRPVSAGSLAGVVQSAMTAVVLAQGAPAVTVSPTASVEIGEREGADEYLFESIPYGRLLSDGRIVVADVGQVVIRVFTSDGVFQTEIGGRGGGPGEFSAINGLWVTAEDRIRVWDAASRRISRFDGEGRLEGTGRVRPEAQLASGNLEVFLGVFGNGDILLASLHLGGMEGEMGAVADRWVMGRFDPDGIFKATLGELRGFRRVSRQPVPFSARPYAAIRGDSPYVVDGVDAEIVVRDAEGNERRTITLGGERVEPPRHSRRPAVGRPARRTRHRAGGRASDPPQPVGAAGGRGRADLEDGAGDATAGHVRASWPASRWIVPRPARLPGRRKTRSSRAPT